MKIMKSLEVLAIVLMAATAWAAPEGSFDSFFKEAAGPGFWGWAFIVIGTIAVGAAVYFTGGLASPLVPKWVASVGSWIGTSFLGLHGAAATSAGLALLGGGSISAGGLGMLGGAMVLVISAEFTTSVAFDYGAGYATQQLSYASFIKDSASMQTLPIVVNDRGSADYSYSVSQVRKGADQLYPKGKGFDIHTAAMQRILKTEAKRFAAKGPASDFSIKDLSYLSILHFQISNYSEAHKYAIMAADLSDRENEVTPVADYLYAVTALYSKSLGATPRARAKLRRSFVTEPKNKMIPLLLGIYMDRLTYRIHGELSPASDMGEIMEIFSSPELRKVAPQSAVVLASRLFIEIKRDQQDILTLTDPKKYHLLPGKKEVDAALDSRLKVLEDLLDVAQNNLLPLIKSNSRKMPKDSPYTLAKTEKLIADYRDNIPDLKVKIAELRAKMDNGI